MINKHTVSDDCDALLSLAHYTAAAVNCVSLIPGVHGKESNVA
jgi:hypothetical protein